MRESLEEYKGHEVYVERDGTFYVLSKEKDQEGEAIATAKTLQELHEILDKMAKNKLLQKTVFLLPSSFRAEHNYIVHGKVTSYKEKRRGYNDKKEFRITWPTKDKTTNWEEHKANWLIKDIPENVALVLEYNKLQADATMLREKASKLLDKMKRHTEEELLG